MTSATEETFQQAMETTANWLQSWERCEVSDEVLADRVAELISDSAGARGFFAITLAGNSPLIDRLPDPILIKLRAAGRKLVDLIVRNLAMSAAMSIYHRNRGSTDQVEGSERVNGRCTELLRLLDSNMVKARLDILLEAIVMECGEDMLFLNRWNYSLEQKRAIQESVEAVIALI
ncbi:hypothetical protein OMCYN_01148 [cyanobiont of Ornithocercus magnificus]|nr:hypothetical protein OMCYN_01148 [cyanobiont of Ornithocercus magnificus]